MKTRTIPLVITLLLATVSCQEKLGPDYKKLTQEERNERKAINIFGANVMSAYYLWSSEISSALEAWTIYDDPIDKVKTIRYKDQNLEDIDRWTEMTDDIDGLIETSNGVTTTYGMDFKLYYTDATKTGICIAVTVVYPDSPAEKAGIKRGDIFLKINGKELNDNNYKDLVFDGFLYAESAVIEDDNGHAVSLKAVEMYEDPILAEKVLDIDGHKVGYLCYNRFTLRSISGLAEVGRRFREADIESIILDMRYNPGGYVLTETALASMLVPETHMKGGDTFHTQVYNAYLAESLGKEETKFTTSVTYKDGGKSITEDLSGSNFGVSKVYAILTGDSASASEGVLVGIMPYMDVKILGQQSHGKYCTGIMVSAQEWYDEYDDKLNKEIRDLGDQYAGKWGMYLMISRYADLNGNTPCMPDGFKPDVKITDNPVQSAPLGDEREPMLAAVISSIKGEKATKASASMANSMLLVPEQPRDPMFGAHILLPEDLDLLH